MPQQVDATPRFRVLVVEDHDGSARGLRALLRARGYRVDVASDAAAALRQATENEYVLVVADCDLGGQDGTELVRTLRRIHPSIRFLMVTARSRDSVLGCVAGLTIDDCLQKPVDPELLLAAVETRTGPR